MSIRFLSGARSVQPGLEGQFLQERNVHNLHQLRMAVFFSLPVSLFLTARFFLSRGSAEGGSLSGVYPLLYGIWGIAGVFFLFFRKGIKSRFSPRGSGRLLLLFTVLFSLTLMGISVLNMLLAREFYSFLLLLLFLSVVVWVDLKTFLILFALGLLSLLGALFARGGARMEDLPDRLVQIAIYSAAGWFVYLSLGSLLMEKFFNRISLEEQYRQLANQSLTDPLTGLYNKRSLEEDLRKEWAKSLRTDGAFCVLMADIDDMREVNDEYGHSAGDTLIKELAGLLRNAVRLSDKVYRFGGEEFLILLPESSLQSAETAAERIRREVEEFRFSDIRRKVTLSMGLAQSHKDINVDILMNRADQKLRQAKKNGRNRIAL